MFLQLGRGAAPANMGFTPGRAAVALFGFEMLEHNMSTDYDYPTAGVLLLPWMDLLVLEPNLCTGCGV